MKLSVGVFWGVVGALCVLWNVAIAPFLPGLRWIEPFFPLLLFFALFRSTPSGFAFAFLVALFMDLYQLASFPGMTLFVLGYFSLLTVLSRRVLTNRSFYSAVVLLFIGRFLAFLLGIFSKGAIGLWNPATMVPLQGSHILMRVAGDVVLLLVLFVLSSRFQRTLHSSPTAGGLVGYF